MKKILCMLSVMLFVFAFAIPVTDTVTGCQPTVISTYAKGEKKAASGKAKAENDIKAMVNAGKVVIEGAGLVTTVYAVFKMFLAYLNDNPERLTSSIIFVIVGIVFMCLPSFVDYLLP